MQRTLQNVDMVLNRTTSWPERTSCNQYQRTERDSVAAGADAHRFLPRADGLRRLLPGRGVGYPAAVIVVIGSPSYEPPEGVAADGVGGLGAAIARAAADEGAVVQFVGKVGDDAAGDALVLALARDGIGHVAILRDASRPTPIVIAPLPGEQVEEPATEVGALISDADETLEVESASVTLPVEIDARPRLEAADLELALRYLTEFAVIVAADALDQESAEVVGAAAAYVGAHVVAVVPPGERPAQALIGATVLEGPAADPDGAFARVVADYAAALDAGSPPGDAFHQVVARDGWEVATA